MTKKIALLVADIHLSENAPLARSAEPDWFKAMARQLRQLRALQAEYGVPIICAGDIFDRYRSSPALINFAMDELPEMYSIPGQHDLPNHRLEDIEKSAYHTLVRVGKIVDLRGSLVLGGLVLCGCPWGATLQSFSENEANERWRDVMGYEGMYQVSSLGRVSSLRRMVSRKSTPQLVNGRILSTGNSLYGQVELRKKGGSSTRRVFYVHRLVLEAFVGSCPNGFEACHVDSDPTNNRLENLKWASHVDNEADKVANGTRPVNSLLLRVAVVHAYCWTTGASYPGAPEDKKVGCYEKRLNGYDVAVFGDNHKGFLASAGGCKVFNCGTFFRRKSDERDCRPCIGILSDDGTITPHYMDVSEDKWLAQDDLKTLDSEKFDFDALVGELAELSPDSLDFRQMLEQCMAQRGTGNEVRSLVLACCEGGV